MRFVIRLAVVLLAVGLVERAPGQLAEQPRLDPADDERLAKTPSTVPDVFLNDSLEAADALSKAADLTARSRWREAAELLHKTGETAGDTLVAVAPGRYVSVHARIAEVVGGWPPTGRDVYLSLAEPQIIAGLTRLGASREMDELLPLFERYFVTEVAARLADRIGQLAMEAGDLALAESVYRRVAESHPQAELYGEPYRAILAVLAAMRGRPPEESPSAAKLRWMGQDRPLAEVLDSVRRDFALLRAPAAPMEWPMFGGDAVRNRLTTTSVDEPGLLWRTSLAADDDGQAIASTSGADAEENPAIRAARLATLFPVTADGLVIAQRARNVYALHGNTGAVAWRFHSPAQTDALDDYFDDRPPEWESPVFHDGRVYAVLPAEEPLFYQYDPARRGAELVCLAAADGRLIWRVDAPSLRMKTSELTLDPSPIVDHGRVYSVVRRRRSFGFEDCYVYRFNAENGAVEFRVHVGSASTSGYSHRPAAVAAFQDGVVYVCSGLGSIAALSAHTGQVHWLSTYPRHREDSDSGSPRFARWWSLNPVIRWEDRLIVLPPDGNDLLLIEAATGRLAAAISLEELGGLQALAGVHQGILCGVGAQAVCYDLVGRELRWSADLPTGGEPSGRPVLATDELLLPTTTGLSGYAIDTGSRKESNWDAAGTGGNLVALPDRLIVADAETVAAYLPKADIWKSLRQRMDAAPDDPLPALEFAEVALGAGEYWESFEVLREAVQRLRKTKAENSSLSQRLFSDALNIAGTLTARGEGDAATLRTLCGFAADHAFDAQSNVEYRLHFAKLFEKSGAPTEALRLYQQILIDRSLRGLDASVHAARPEKAVVAAERRIAQIIETNGRDVYTEYETEAAKWLRSAQAANSEDAFRRVFETFPNAAAAGAAIVACGEWLSAGGRHEEAWRLFAKAYGRQSAAVDGALVARRIADALAAAGRPEAAYRWLTKADRDLPRATIEHDGRRISLLEYRKRLDAIRDRVEPSRPTLTLPLSPTSPGELGEHSALLVPRFDDLPGYDVSRFFAASREAIAAYDGRTATRLWTHAVRPDARPELLTARDGVAVFATTFEVFALDVATGALRWRFGEAPDHAADPGRDWEDGGALRTHAIEDDRLISARDNGLITAVSVRSGDLLWRQTHRPAAFGPLRVVYPWIVYHIVQDGRANLCVLDSNTGEWLAGIPTDESRPIEDLFVTLDGRAVVISSRAISAYALDLQTKLWQSPVSGQIRPGSVVIDWDALYFSDNGVDLEKIRLADGAYVWQSDRVAERGVEDLTVNLVDAALIAATSTSVAAIDTNTGLMRWQGIAPERPRFEHRMLSDRYIVVIDSGGEVREEPSKALFYEYKNGSGKIPEGGGLDLGRIERIKSALVTTSGLVIDTGNQLHVYLSPSTP